MARVNFKPEKLMDKVAIQEANEAIKQFAESGESSPAFEYIQQALSGQKTLKNIPIQVKQTKSGENYYSFKLQHTTKKQQEALGKLAREYLSKKTSTPKKQEQLLRQSWKTFTEKRGINRRSFTFNKYKQVFEKYRDAFTDSAIAIVSDELGTFNALAGKLKSGTWQETLQWLEDTYGYYKGANNKELSDAERKDYANKLSISLEDVEEFRDKWDEGSSLPF